MKEKVLPTKAVLKTIMKIITQKPGPIVVIKKNSQDAEILGAIYLLENIGLIYNLRHIEKKEDKYAKGDVIFVISNREALWNYYLEHYEDNVKLLKRPKKENKKKVETKNKDVKAVEMPKFRFSNGVLFRDFCNETLAIKNENS